jgi:biotin operon repressor
VSAAGLLFLVAKNGTTKGGTKKLMAENKNTFEQMGQFTKIPFDFIENAKSLSWHARWLYVTLMYYRNGKSGEAFPSYDKITELTRMRREKISKSIEELERWGWIQKHRRYSNSNVYTLNFENPLRSRERSQNESAEAD